MTAVNMRKSTSARGSGVFLTQKGEGGRGEKNKEKSLWIITSRKPDKETGKEERINLTTIFGRGEGNEEPNKEGWGGG